ncbi:MAG: hypothetical protein ACOCUW_04880, partial [Gemmatimonadota bacterium]
MKRASPILLLLALAGCGTDVSGPSSSLLTCVFSDPVATAAGEVVQVAGDRVQGVCLDGDAGADFVYIPFFASPESGTEVALDVTGAGMAEIGTVARSRATAAPAPMLGDRVDRSRPLPDRRFHDRLRAREIRELEPRIKPAAGPPVALQGEIAGDVPVVGELRDFNTAISCEEVDLRTGRVMYVSDRAVIYADTANPADLTSQDYAYFGDRFDSLVYPVETAHFGPPTDIDENGRSILFFTRAVNEMNPQGSPSVTIGFFWSGDLFPETETDRLQACPESNHGEMFYLLAPDPNGVAGVPFDLAEVRDVAIPLIGHEFQHLINASRRLFVNNANAFEEPWLNEGLSHAAEEILFYAESGMETGRNIGIEDFDTQAEVDAFNRYMGANFSNYAKYLSRPDTASLMGEANELATRGAAWSFLRYAADRSGAGDESFFFDVVNGREGGIRNLDDVLGDGVAFEWMQDWTVSIYADDLVPGIAPEYTIRSWNLRSVYEGSTLEAYPLELREIGNGGTVTDDLLAGGTVYHPFEIDAGGRAVIHATADGRTPSGAVRGS